MRCFALVSLFAAAPCLAQSGVLIGVQMPRQGAFAEVEAPEPVYRTFWVVHTGDTVQLAVTLSDIVVPHGAGFWRVGSTRACTFYAAGAGAILGQRPTQGGDEATEDHIWTAPAGTAPTVDIGAACQARDTTSDTASTGITACGYTHLDYTFVSPAFLAVHTYSGLTEDCEPRGGRWDESYTVRSFERPDSLTLSQFAGQGALAAFQAALDRGAKQLARQGLNCGAAVPVERDDDWFLPRNAGHWGAFAFQQPSASGECQYEDEVRLPLPTRLTGYDALHPTWSVLKARAPKLTDAFSSPAGDLVVVVRDSTFEFFASRGDTLGRSQLKLPGAHVVMIQWATGAYVQKWTDKLSRMGQSPQPAPVIKSSP